MNIGLSALRSIACLMILFDHSIYYSSIAPNVSTIIPWWVTGFLGGSGVAIFFTLSGHLMVNIANNSSPMNFIGLRFIRIFPGYWLAVLIYFISKANLSQFNWQSFFLLPFANNFNTYNIPAWTLFYEVQFYLYIFFLLLISKFIKNLIKIIYFFSIIWIIIIIYYCLFINSKLNSQIPGFEIIFSSINLIFIGGIFAKKINVNFLIKRNYINLIIGSILYFFSLYIEPSSNRLFPNIILSLGSIFLLNFFINLDLNFSLLESFANKSYGVYLIHLIIMDIIFLLLQNYGFNSTYQFIWFIILTFMVFFPSLFFGVLENKLHQILKSFVRK